MSAPHESQEMSRINHSQKDLSDEITSAKAQLRNRQQVRYGAAQHSIHLL